MEGASMTTAEIGLTVGLIGNVIGLGILLWRGGAGTQKVLDALVHIEEKHVEVCQQVNAHVSNRDVHPGSRVAVLEANRDDLNQRISRLELASNGKSK
jgi:hypothetical protein